MATQKLKFMIFALVLWLAPALTQAALPISDISKAEVVAKDYNEMRTLFELTEHVMFSKRLYEFFNKSFPMELQIKGLTSTQVMYILANGRDHWGDLILYAGTVTDANVEEPKIKEFRKQMAEKIGKEIRERKLDEQLAGMNSAAQPLVLKIKGQKNSYSSMKIYVDHPSLKDPQDLKSDLVKADDLKAVLIKFINGAEKEIWGNFFENNNLDVAEALIAAKKRGVKVSWGMDKNTVNLTPNNTKFLEMMQAEAGPEFHVVLIDPVGLNHQKMVVRDPRSAKTAALLQSSGNNTQSCIGKEGDLVHIDPKLRDKRSLPNANHTMIFTGQLPALVGEYQLRKNLFFQIRGEKAFPVDGSYLLPGPKDKETKENDFVILAYSPNGGMGDVNTSLLVPVISRTHGALWTMQFAFSSPDVIAAIENRILADKNMDFRSIGDTPFAMQNWSGFLALSGMQRADSGIYSENKDSALVKGLNDKQLAELRGHIRVNPTMFGDFYQKFKDEKGKEYSEKISVKLHHKVWVFPDDLLSVVGTSFNVSTSAETNQENLALVRNREVTDRIGGALMYLWSRDGVTSVAKQAEIRNARHETDSTDESDSEAQAEEAIGKAAGQ